ncbi:PP2C family protein-serine/threonine phosphatase [Actinokineospora diospyrosa]|uniref:Serine phosphatase RsbU, regulator of sigma subunit n=1 Tax=Actinokineospora diospyrosa TaxID=103728 RepID=A0ABT1IJQ8_9PSEU|nr:GAF domain-containing SpoIIE family protein phosphatase [Actinokineospora diospyrosa]MCP2272877.1 Serine phosphatase RsbU, regulator of sigma subunit [Actinokineospora diospyrosa]
MAGPKSIAGTAPAAPPPLGAHTAHAPTEHQLLDQARQRASLAGEITSQLAGSLNLRRTILRLFALITPELADWAMLAMVDHRTGRVALHGGHDHTFATTVDRDRTEDLGVGRVLRSGQSELLHVALAPEGQTPTADGLDSMIPHDALRAEATALRPADVLGLALTARGTTVGMLVLVRGAGRGFPEDDVALAEQIAGRAAMALDSARLYEDRNRVASVLQASLRPPALPRVPGLRLAARFRAAAEHLDIGGDFYDVHGSERDWLLAIGDVCGKGVEAAVLTGRARQSIRTAAHFDRSPRGVLAALNAVLYEEESDKFVTAVCARVRPAPDSRTAEVDLAAAGHPAPLVLRADGTVEQVDVAGTVAGVLPEVGYQETTIALGPGDTMLMFTDGIYEARGPEGFYGLDRVIGLLPAYAGAGPEAVCEALEQDVVEHLGGRAHDDMALFAVACGR